MKEFYHDFFEGLLVKHSIESYRGIKIVGKASGRCHFSFFEISLQQTVSTQTPVTVKNQKTRQQS
ncbi:MAG: hypothetical protein EBR01_14085 [Proteobacteria bacterium]|nr:hypothetical protein [Pseudomonadota bacterium]